MDHLVYYDDAFAAADWPGQVFSFLDTADHTAHAAANYVDAVTRISQSPFVDAVTPDTIIIIDRTAGPVADKTTTGLTSITNHVGQSALLIGEDTSDWLIDGASNDMLEGRGGDDKIMLTLGNDKAYGGAGRDTFIFKGSFGTDTIYDFSENEDSLSFDGLLLSRTVGVDLDADGARDDTVWRTSFGTINLLNVATVADTNLTAGNDVMHGTNTVDFIHGLAGSDTIDGWQGGDFVYGEAGADNLCGGPGSDYLYGGDGNDILSGRLVPFNPGDTRLLLLAGDTVFTDRMFGGSGDDRFLLNGGNAVVIGGDGVDSAEFNTQVIVNLAAGAATSTAMSYFPLIYTYAQSTTQAQFTLSLIENVVGSSWADTITGDISANVLAGREGDDTLGGGDGNDTLLGGMGADALSGGTGTDTASYVYSQVVSPVTVNLATGIASGGDAAGDTFSSIENLVGSNFSDSLTGSVEANAIFGAEGNDSINGLGAADLLFGGPGSDTLNGGAGRDVLTGGAGADKFVFDAAVAAANADTVADFSKTEGDKIVLENATFAALGTGVGTLSAASFWSGVSAHDADDRIVYDGATGNLYYDADGRGGAGAIVVAILAARPVLAAGDFQVI